MAVRTTSVAVAGIIEVQTSPSVIPLDPFIETASSVVDEVEANDTDTILGSSRLELIERWLSAHFYCMRDPRTTSEAAGPVSASYQSRVDLGLKTSHYGQMAITLDSTGYLAALSNGKVIRAGVTWLGTDPCEQDSNQ